MIFSTAEGSSCTSAALFQPPSTNVKLLFVNWSAFHKRQGARYFVLSCLTADRFTIEGKVAEEKNPETELGRARNSDQVKNGSSGKMTKPGLSTAGLPKTKLH